MTLLNIPRNGTWQFEVVYPGVAEAESRIIYTRDEYGLRGTNGKTDNVILVTLGGSTTEQLLISEGFTWQDVLEKEFESAGFDFGIANAGLSGRTSFGHIQDMRQWLPLIPDFSPRFVMFYLGINDMFYDHGNPDKDTLVYDHQGLKEIIKNRSALYYLYRTSVGVYLARKHELDWSWIDYANARWTNTPNRQGYHDLLEPRLEEYRARLYVLNQEAKKMNAVPIFVTQRRGDYRVDNGVVYGVVKTNTNASRIFTDSRLGELNSESANGVDYYIILNLFNDVLLQVCREVGGICIDLAREINFEVGDFYDHVHYTRSGARKIGKYLFAILEKEFRTIH